MSARGVRARGFGLLAAALLSVTLAGCGGGGGDDEADQIPPPGDVDLNAANQTSAARAAAIAVQGGMVITATGVTGSSQGTTSVAKLVQHASLKAVKPLSTTRERAQGLLDVSFLFTCFSGTVTATLDDRDNSLSVTPGDVLSASLVNCQVDPASDELIHGALTATYTQAAQAPLTVAATVELVNLRDSSLLSGRSATLNGGFSFSYVEPNASTSTTQITVSSALSIAVVHPLYQDTVVLQPGYGIGMYYDLATPPGVATGGRTVIEVAGKVSSARVGGIFTVWSQPPGLELWDNELYPRSGWVRLQGRSSEVRLTALSSTSVRLELDANGDGSFEASQDVPWDTLL